MAFFRWNVPVSLPKLGQFSYTFQPDFFLGVFGKHRQRSPGVRWNFHGNQNESCSPETKHVRKCLMITREECVDEIPVVLVPGRLENDLPRPVISLELGSNERPIHKW